MSAIKKVILVPENGQISIGKTYAGKLIQIESVEDGLLITPGSFVPDHLRFFYTEEAKQKLDNFNKHIQQNKKRERTADDIFTEIDADRSE